MSSYELEIIKSTLPQEARDYVQLNERGFIDDILLRQYSGNSLNFTNLLELVETDMVIVVSAADSYSYSDREGIVHNDGSLSYMGIDELFKDTNIEFTSGLSTGEVGNYGKTLFPDLDGVQNSSSGSIEVYIHPSLSMLGAAEAFSHEGFGHALLYIRNGHDHNGASHQVERMQDTNTVLVEMILNARRDTIKNNPQD